MKKIMFNDKYGLTDAVLQGSKTMTRRMVGNRMTDDDIKAYLKGYTELADKAAPYKIGEVVAVAQSYSSFRPLIIHNDDYSPSHPGWNNKMFVRAELMPHRIRITDVKVERLQDISDDDCLNEGIYVSDTFMKYGIRNGYSPQCTKDPKEKKWWFGSPREAFASLIERPGIGHKGDWGKNPWVFAYSFELVNL